MKENSCPAYDEKGVYMKFNNFSLEKRILDEIYNRISGAILIWNLKGEILGANNFFLNLFNMEEKKVIGKKWNEILFSEIENKKILEVIDLISNNGDGKNFEYRIITKTGKIIEMIWSNTLISDSVTGEPLIISLGMDKTEERENEKKIFDLAFKDSLTGLKNRAAFESDILPFIDAKNSFTLFYLDFDNFKNINDVYGYKYGDLFIEEYSKRLSKKFPVSSIYRWCGDEFLIVEKSTDEKKIAEIINNIMDLTKEKWIYGEIEHYPSVSIGISRFPLDGENIEELLKNIDVAMTNAKSKGKSRASCYDKSFKKEIERRIFIENKINYNLLNNGFKLNFQPIYSMNDMTMVGIEVLLRCKDTGECPDIGELISIAETTGQIVSIDRWVIDNAFMFIKENLENKNIVTSINLSAKSVNSWGIMDFLKANLKDYKLNPQNIKFEITEHSLIDDIDYSKKLIEELKKIGFKISLDDFGTRYSSINYLVNMPFDTLKIDKSYIDKIIERKNSRTIVELIIKCSKELGLDTTAEGIESEEQFRILKDLGCDLAQGYLLNKPMDIEKLLNLKEFRQ
jgi:diguanylate cyclase (GGDEF)-like protein/PAS domain S-box-containing protein